MKRGDKYWHPIHEVIVVLSEIHSDMVIFYLDREIIARCHFHQDRKSFENMCVPNKIYNTPLFQALNSVDIPKKD